MFSYQTKQKATRTVIQPKLKIGQPGDKYEREADTVADRVMRMSESATMQMQPIEEEEEMMQPKLRMQPMEEEEEALQAKYRSDHEVSTGLSNRLRSTQGNGTILPLQTNRLMSDAIGTDFSGVKIHTDHEAAQMNQQLGARAFTFKNNVYFNSGEYNPNSSDGRGLIAHELTHVQQQTNIVKQPGSIKNSKKADSPVVAKIQRDLASDIRDESALPPERRRDGQLGILETRSRTAADAAFQERTGNAPLPEGSTGRATQIINHISDQIDRLESARARGYIQAVTSIIGELTMNDDQRAQFWTAFAGNTLWALSGLVPLLGPVVGVTRIALAGAPGMAGVMLRTNAIGRFLERGGGAVASSVVGLAGAELAQFSGGMPSSGTSLPSTMQQVQTTFTNLNSRVMSRYRSEAFALTLEFLNSFDSFVVPQTETHVSADSLESFTKGCVMETLFADLNNEHILDRSNYTIDTGRAQEMAKNILLDHIIDVWFTNQIASVGMGARNGVLQIELASRYPNASTFSIDGGNIVGSASEVDLIRSRLAGRPLKEINIPKVIRMNGSMGHGFMDCNWNITVTGEGADYPRIESPAPRRTNYERMNEVPQHVVGIAGHPSFGLPWLAAYYLGLSDLSRDDPRNTNANQSEGARAIWAAIKEMVPGTVGNSPW